MQRYITKSFIDEIYSKPPKRNYETNKIIYNHIDEIWSIDLADFSDYKTSNNKGFRHIFIIIDKFSKHVRAIRLKNKNSETITDEFSNILTISKRSVNLESDRAAEFYNSISQNILKSKNIHQYSRFRDKGPSIAERIIRTMRNLLKKPVFGKGKADWISELPSVIKKYNNTIHSSTKMTPIQASKEVNEKIVFCNLQDRRVRQQPKIKLGQVRSADMKKVFSKGDSTIFPYELHAITEVIHDTLPSYRINYLPERYNQILFLPTKLTLDESNQVMKKLNLIHNIKIINGIN